MQHDINPGTFYNWVKRLRQKACYEIPAATGRAGVTAAVKQDVVKIDVIPDAEITSHPVVVQAPITDADTEFSPAPIEIRIHEAVIRITNDIDPRHLAQILRNLGGYVC